MTTLNLFSTPVKIVSFPNFEEINKKIGKAMQLGFTNNFTDNLPEEEGRLLQKIFIDEAELYLKEVSNKKVDLKITKSWITHTSKFGFNTPHCHADNTVIGVYYIRTSDKCGDLLLHDPRGSHSFVPKYEINTAGASVSDRTYHRIIPRCGRLILCPSYVVHSVEPNMSDEVRISLAMNFRYKEYNQFK
jgi:uncharacterized protein (TIGR02466 family)